jgi:hypothetical protein
MVQKHKREIASHHIERKLWALRKFYGGNGGALPPTDPRILSMTEAQIDIEFQHILLDREEREAAAGNKVYVDDDYEREEAEEARVDSLLYVEPDEEPEEPEGFSEEVYVPDDESYSEEDWQDVDDDETYDEPSEEDDW